MPARLRRVMYVVLVALAALAMGGASSPVRAQRPIDVAILLDRYSSGERAAVLELLKTLDDVEGVRVGLEATGRAWTEAAGPAVVPRRRLTAATFALELANTRMQDEWRRLRSLIEWGCELVRAGAPSEAERLWQLASVALAEGARDWDVLYTRPPPVRVAAYNHLSHARSRFSDDVRLDFADAAIQAIRVASGFPPHRGNEAPRAQPRGEVLRARFDAIEHLQMFAHDPVVGGEAALRTGLAWLSIDRVDEAMRQFEIASRSTDEFAVYLAHVLAGQMQDRYGTPEGASAQYRAALQAIPRAQSASLGLAAILLSDGQPDEAYALLHEALAAPIPMDPWRVYGQGSYYRFPEYVELLVRELGR